MAAATFEEIKARRSRLLKVHLKNLTNELLDRQVESRSPRPLPEYRPSFPMETIENIRIWAAGEIELTPGVEKEMLLRFQQSPPKSLERQQAANSIVRTYVRAALQRAFSHSAMTGVEAEDLVQESIFGIIRAAEKADLSRENRFLTYAVTWIDQTMSRYAANSARTVRLPAHADTIVRKCRGIRRKDFLEGREARSTEALAAELGTTLETLNLYLFADQIVFSLESNLEELSEIAVDEQLEETVFQKLLVEDIEYCLDSLHPREAGVIRSRFGLGDGVPMTLDQIGEKFGVTRERIRQVEKKAITRLRDAWVVRILAPYAAELGILRSEKNLTNQSGLSVETNVPERVEKSKHLASTSEDYEEVAPAVPAVNLSDLEDIWTRVKKRVALSQKYFFSPLSPFEHDAVAWVTNHSDKSFDEVLELAGGISKLCALIDSLHATTGIRTTG